MLEKVKLILENENIDEAIKLVNELSNYEELHILASNYNWDNGFKIPIAILSNQSCDMGTALMMFYLADGYVLLSDKDQFEKSNLNEWKNFISDLMEKIVDGKFGEAKISYKIPLTKVQLFKLKKENENIPEILITDTLGTNINIPTL